MIQSRLHDAALAVLLAVVAAVMSFSRFVKIPEPVITRDACVNLLFEGDVPYVFDSLSSASDKHHRRSNRHALFSLVSFPPVRIIQVVTGLPPLSAIRWVVALSAGLWAALLFIVLRLMGCRRLDASLFSVAGILSAASAIWWSIPETWGFGSIAILAALLIAALSQYRAVHTGWYLAASVLTLGSTTTNWMAGLALKFFSFPWRRAVKLSLIALAIVAVILGVEKLFFKATRIFPRVHYVKGFLFQPESGGPGDVARVFFLHAMVMPKVEAVSRENRPGERLTVQHVQAGSAGLLNKISVGLWVALLSIGGWAIARLKGHRVLRRVVAATLAGQLLLHFVFGGEETFLYALHWIPLLVVVAAFGSLTRARKLVLGLASVFVLTLAINNHQQFGRIAQWLHTNNQCWTGPDVELPAEAQAENSAVQ